MAVQFKSSGVVLFKQSGTVAMDANCCCDPPVETDCCAEPIPFTLTGTITNKTGSAVGLPDTVTLTHNPPVEWLTATGDMALGCDAGMASCQINFGCDISPAFFAGSVPGCQQNGPKAPTSVTCDPLEVVFDNIEVYEAGGCSAGTFTMTVTV